MKKSVIKTIAIVLLFCFLVLINVLPVFVFRGKAALTDYSTYPIIFAVLVTIHGIMAFFFRHKGNFLVVGRYGGLFRTFEPNVDYTYTEEYLKEFYRMLFIHFAVIPFHIPVIFFSTRTVHSLWSALIVSVPNMIYVVLEISKILHDVREQKQKELQQEKELREQEKREELGRWK